ncbi:IscS subfamily cysteine desulfurase [Thalassobacillus devorans]|uniref:IscS subfamily cysteine desulfurase n=1 Tax=Thalassobacillus devorans TaxID=279813 RepID=UPI00048D7C1E|nr:IscS subfamily cysteine desulfurase [Thalassobacillus devorans]
MIYFDYAATCPIDDMALKVYNEAAKSYYGNTVSLHDQGTTASALLEHCRRTLADQAGVKKEGIYFTSGGTESNHIGLSVLAKAREGKHIITAQAEHSSVHYTLEKLANEGYSITKIPFTEEGIVNLEALEAAIRKDTAVVSIQLVNGEIGTLQPVNAIYFICQKWGIFFHSDCIQAFGKVDLTKYTKYMDSFSISSHKIYGPKGVGAVYLTPPISIHPDLLTGSHEKGVRAGTVNVPGIAAFTAAAQENVSQLENHQKHLITLNSAFKQAIFSVQDKLKFVGNTHEDASIIGLLLSGIEGQWAMLEANRKGYAISTGSACTLHEHEPARTLLAMGFSGETAKTFVRISFGKQTTIADVQGLADCLIDMLTVTNQP